MKKIISIMLFMIIVSICFVLTSCDKEEQETYYVATADFFYSKDKGHSFGNGTKEYEIGETIYMQVKAKVTSNKGTPEPIKVKLTIPNITALNATYFDGQPITPTYDTVKNVTVYEFTIPANGPDEAGKFVFEFIPNSEAQVTMTLVFEDKIDSMYDKQNTIKFVAAKTNEAGEYLWLNIGSKTDFCLI